jgi:hypothetical protein
VASPKERSFFVAAASPPPQKQNSYSNLPGGPRFAAIVDCRQGFALS